jgi:sulfite reductase (NADPH) flavoprotein alpha-component
VNETAEPLAVPPVAPETLARIESAVAGLDAAQLQWVSGYLAGLATGGGQAVANPKSESAASLTILYGSQTGNGRRIAETLAAEAASRGLAAQAINMADYSAKRLKRERFVALVVSTHGEGDPPDDALELHGLLGGRRRPGLSELSFSVLALGDSSYELFCQTGRDFDRHLAAAGACRAAPLAECDVDYEKTAALWQDTVLEQAESLLGADAARQTPALRAVPTGPRWDRKSPFAAELLLNQPITGRGSTKDVRHIELSLEGSGLTYLPGDALGVVNPNPEWIVEPVSEALGLRDDRSLRALTGELEITSVNRRFLEAWADLEPGGRLARELEETGSAGLGAWMRSRQVIDVLRAYPAELDPDLLLTVFRPLTPRLYSIASAPEVVEEEVHLTVAHVNYRAHDADHWGAASSWLALGCSEADPVSVYVEPNDRFRLPEDPDRNIIMVGPGTGIAPFRAFVQSRQDAAGSGRNWLFFGDRNFATDFLYQSEWLRYRRQGVLYELDVAFSRDQAEKVYVQHRLAERGRELYAWLQEGAHFYVCGDATRMAPDVETVLLDIVREHGAMTADSAVEYLAGLRKAGRYQRDVY